ncbi:MAG: hypothetical protein Q7S51_10730 [Gallionellaceae bacterium]|nr:hypothetical protein [Gallionellaceae bacterium]
MIKLVRARPALLIYFSFWFIYFIYVWSQALRLDPNGELMAGNDNLWADWVLHFMVSTSMAYRDLLPHASPLLLDAPFHYPFISNLISALLLKAGASFPVAFAVPSLIFSLLLVGTLYYFFNALFRSTGIAVLASWIFLLNGGLGFVYFLQDILASAEPLATFFSPPRDYTYLEDHHVVVQSLINSILIPQRSFTHGFPVALLALTLIYTTLENFAGVLDRTRIIKLVTAAILLGLLPLIHTHSFIGVFVILCFWSVGYLLFSKGPWLQRAKPWLLIGGVTSIIALPLLKLFILDHSTSNFMHWLPGWQATERSVNWLWFWFKNWGVLPVLAVAGLIWLIRTQDTARKKGAWLFVLLPFFVIFALVNLVSFQPWSWDNTKLLTWATLGFAGLSAYCIVQLWQHGMRVFSSHTGKPILAVLMVDIAIVSVLLCTTSGAIAAYRVARIDMHRHAMFSVEEMELAAWVTSNTAADSVWLSSDHHHNWLALTGRQIMMAYRGWLWSHGYSYSKQEQDIQRIYSTADPQLLKDYRINYIVVGPNERETWKADSAVFAQHYPVIKSSSNYLIFKIN